MSRVDFQAWARRSLLLAAAAVALSVGGREAQTAPIKETPKVEKKENKNTLIAAYRDKLELSCSTAYGGWPVERLIDGNLGTSWFSASNDSAAKGTKPWVQITFPEDVKVSRVSVMGNREDPYQKNYSVLSGMIEFLDKDGKPLWTEELKGAGDAYDFEFTPKKPVEKVRSVKFTSVKDEGDQNGFGDIALGEILIE
jgi:hypothetical protein